MSDTEFDTIIDSVLRGTEEDRRRDDSPVDIDQLARDAAISSGKYRELVYTDCPVCGRRYSNLKYMKYLLDNEVYPLNTDTARRLMNYSEFNECCDDLLDDLPDPEMEESDLNGTELMIHYCMSRGIDVTDELLQRMRITSEEYEGYRRSYRTPPLDSDSAESFNDWLSGTDDIDSLRFTLVRDESNDLEINRHCRQLKYCTSCGTENTYAYLYWFLSILGVSREDIFLDFQVLRPCCRATYQSPIMKPIEYEHERMTQVFRGTRSVRPAPVQSVIKLPTAIPKIRSVPKSVPKKAPPKSMPKLLVPKKAPPKLQIRRR